MKKTLCFDFGNTRLKAAVFENDLFKEEIVLPDEEISAIENLLAIHHPQIPRTYRENHIVQTVKKVLLSGWLYIIMWKIVYMEN